MTGKIYTKQVTGKSLDNEIGYDFYFVLLYILDFLA